MAEHYISRLVVCTYTPLPALATCADRGYAVAMSDTTPWVFVDCEARGTSPVHGVLTEFGAVHYDTRDTFHGRLFDATPDPDNPAISIVGERIATDKEVAESFAA